MQLGRLATEARPKSEFHLGKSCHSTCLALVSNWVLTDGISFSQSSSLKLCIHSYGYLTEAH